MGHIRPEIGGGVYDTYEKGRVVSRATVGVSIDSMDRLYILIREGSKDAVGKPCCLILCHGSQTLHSYLSILKALLNYQ